MILFSSCASDAIERVHSLCHMVKIMAFVLFLILLLCVHVVRFFWRLYFVFYGPLVVLTLAVVLIFCFVSLYIVVLLAIGFYSFARRFVVLI